MSLEVRLDEIDADHVRRLILDLLADLDERYGDGSPELAERYLTEIKLDDVTPPRGAFVVAWLGGEPVGCGAVRGADDVEGTAEIRRMYTKPSARRRGVSRAILAELEAQAVALGYERLRLETGLEQPEAMALYESAGWKPIESYGQWYESELSRCYGKEISDGQLG